jgi:hypothetical protein
MTPKVLAFHSLNGDESLSGDEGGGLALPSIARSFRPPADTR